MSYLKGRQLVAIVSLLLLWGIGVFIPDVPSAVRIATAVSIEQDNEEKNFILAALAAVPEWGRRIYEVVKKDVDSARRRKLRASLLKLSDNLSYLETSKRNLNSSLMENDIDFYRVQQNLKRVADDIQNFEREVTEIRSLVQTEVSGGAELERALSDAMMRKGMTVAEMKRRAMAEQPVNPDLQKVMRKEGEDLLRLVHEAQNALIEILKALS